MVHAGQGGAIYDERVLAALVFACTKVSNRLNVITRQVAGCWVPVYHQTLSCQRGMEIGPISVLGGVPGGQRAWR